MEEKTATDLAPRASLCHFSWMFQWLHDSKSYTNNLWSSFPRSYVFGVSPNTQSSMEIGSETVSLPSKWMVSTFHVKLFRCTKFDVNFLVLLFPTGNVHIPSTKTSVFQVNSTVVFQGAPEEGTGTWPEETQEKVFQDELSAESSKLVVVLM